MRRWFSRGPVAVIAVLLALVPVQATALSKKPPSPPPEPAPFSFPSTGIGGTARYAGGEWIAQDFVYDDGELADNAADLVELRVRIDGSDLLVRSIFNTLRPEDATVLGIALGSPSSEARAWPSSPSVSSPWDRFVTVVPSAGTATVTDATGASTSLAAPVVDFSANTVAVTVPGAGASAGTLRLNAAAGDASTLIDLAFNSREQEGQESGLRDEAQNAAIESGDVSAMSVDIDFAALAAKRTDAPITASGPYDAVFKSRQAVAEGYGEAFPMYQGLYQPYVMWLPEDLDPSRPTPLVLVLHSLSNIHTQYDVGVYEQVAGARDAVAITPLAMGDDGWYWDEALIDTLDAWADVRKRFTIDADRTFSSGYSMGGYGTYRLATLLPDLIAAGISWVGPPTDGIWAGTDFTEVSRTPGLTYSQLENTYNVPFFIVHGTNDEPVPVQGVTRQAQRMYELGHEHQYNLHPGQDHLTFAIINDWTREAQWLQGRSLVTTPSRVTFKSRPATWLDRDADMAPDEYAALFADLTELAAELGGSAFDSAYWVRGVQAGGVGDVTGFVDLTSSGIADRVPVTRDTTGVGVFGSSPHIVRGLDRIFTFAPPANSLSGTLTNVTELTVDLARARLSIDSLELDVTSDIGTVIHLVDGTRSATVTVAATAPA